MVHLLAAESRSLARTLPDECGLDRLQVVSWDVDGTLYSLHRMKIALCKLGIEKLRSRQAACACREFVQLERFRYKMNRIRARGGDFGPGDLPEHRPALLEIEKRWYGPAISSAGIRSGVIELIELFRKAGLRQIVVSDYLSAYKLEALALRELFDACYAGETLGYIKPSVKLFYAVTDDLGIEPGNLLHIGDRQDCDGVAAKAAGCQVHILRRRNCAFEEFLLSRDRSRLGRIGRN